MENRHMHDIHTEAALPLPGMSFWAESPEAAGHIPDACPMATAEWLIAVAGRADTPLYTVEMGGIDGLYDVLYGDLLPRSEANTAILRTTFGESEQESVHPVGRYAAVLAEATVPVILSGAARGASPEQSAILLGGELTRCLEAFRLRLAADGAEEATMYGVRLAACRLQIEDEGLYTMDILSAGDYRLYLVDAGGMHEVWAGAEAPFTPGEQEAIVCHRVELIHPEPFALLLLSAGAACPEEITAPGKEPSGRVWRHRMRLEEAVLHLLTACLREQEFGDRAAQYFAGHIHRGYSAAGALLVHGDEAGFEGLIGSLRTRLHTVEELLPLLPEDYHTATTAPIPTRYETEVAYLSALAANDPSVADRGADAVYLSALERIRTRGTRAATPPKPAPDVEMPDTLLGGTAPMIKLAPPADELIDPLFAEHNRVNAEDLAALAENRAAMKEALIEHWVTWRPLMTDAESCTEAEHAHDTTDRTDKAFATRLAYRAARNRDHVALRILNARLSERLAERRTILDDLDRLLVSATRRLRGEGNDWLCGRGGDDNATAWVGAVSRELMERLGRFDAQFRADTDRYRSLLVAYRCEREWLFLRDTEHPDGVFAVCWRSIQDGTLPTETWHRWLEAVDKAGLGADYRSRLEAIRGISEGCGALLRRIERRGADRLTARELSRRADLRVAALRASVYCAPGWATEDLLTEAQMRDLVDCLRRREEAERLALRRREAFEAYRVMYRQV